VFDDHVVESLAAFVEELLVDGRTVHRLDDLPHRGARAGDGQLHAVGDGLAADAHVRESGRRTVDHPPGPDAQPVRVLLNRRVEVADNERNLLDFRYEPVGQHVRSFR